MHPVISPFQYTFGAEKFEWLVDNRENSDDFNAFMTGRREGTAFGNWLDFYPMSENFIDGAGSEDGAVFCVDVGGGKGHDLVGLSDRFPNLPGCLVLQDLEKVVGCSSVFTSMAHDFFQLQPIKGIVAQRLPLMP